MSKVHVYKKNIPIRFADVLREVPYRKYWLRRALKRDVGQNAVTRRAHMPRALLRTVERSMKVRFKFKPRLYYYVPKAGTELKEEKVIGQYMGLSHVVQRTSDGKPLDCAIILPRGYLRDKKYRDVVLEHELAETLAVQHGIPLPLAHKMALTHDNAYVKRLRLKDRKALDKRLIELYNENRKWKPVI